MVTHDVMQTIKAAVLWLWHSPPVQWFGTSKPSDWLTGIAAIWALSAAKRSGLLDAKRLALEASKSHLEIDKQKLEDEKIEIQEQIQHARTESAELQMQIGSTQQVVNALRQERVTTTAASVTTAGEKFTSRDSHARLPT
jgi:hypothetical protein